MNRAALLGLAVFSLTVRAYGQPLMVYSEFAKIDAQGNVVAPESPREILSPAIARNAFSTFQVVVQTPPGAPYTLRVGLNPENAVKVTLYRETKEPSAGGPTLERIEEPWDGSSTQVFWMDLWVEKDAPVRRIKVEPQLFLDGDWVIYPMEVRVREQQVPERNGRTSPTRGFLEPFAVMQASLCSKPISTTEAAAITAASLRYRNALQDVAMAEGAPAPDREELKKRLGGCGAKLPGDPEAYLRVRDYFFTPYWMKVKGK